jgi:predicted nucleic acid-binding protein
MPIQRVYWDANVFHALFSKEKGRVENCERLYEAAKGGKLTIYTSAITFVECVWLKGLQRLSKEHEAVIQKFFMHHFIEIVNCDRFTGTDARRLLWQFSHLEPKDAIHVASALSQQVEILHSNDKDLLRLNGKLGSQQLKICEPGKEEADFSLGK